MADRAANDLPTIDLPEFAGVEVIPAIDLPDDAWAKKKRLLTYLMMLA